jgi:hypothetical protein
MSDKDSGKNDTRKTLHKSSVLPTSQVKVPMPKVSAPKPAKPDK